MKRVIIASENPVKVRVAESAFAQVWPDQKFEFIAVKSDSGVADQPMNEETLIGAENRLRAIQISNPEADF
jgi:non-canonical (house-cleaning) NTP pyrophosphatase